MSTGANPESLLTDQRGFAPRTGPDGTDIGAYQHDAESDTQAPTAALQAVDVTGANAASLNPYAFTITFSDNVGIAAASLSGAVVQVVPPGAIAPITATVAEHSRRRQYRRTTATRSRSSSHTRSHRPAAAWTLDRQWHLYVTLGGAPVTDLSGQRRCPGDAWVHSPSL